MEYDANRDTRLPIESADSASATMDILNSVPGLSDPIAKRNVRDQIYDKLAFMINHGLLRPGDELPAERRIAETLGVSRETVRSSLTLLREKGMISTAHGTRTQVLGPTSLDDGVVRTPAHAMARNSSPQQVYQARALIEAEVVRLATLLISDQTIDRLRTLLKEQEGMIRDPVSFQMSDMEFHMTLYEACGNPLLFAYVAELYTFALDVRRRVLMHKGAIARSVHDHRVILEAIARRDPEGVVAAMSAHLDRVHSTTIAELK